MDRKVIVLTPNEWEQRISLNESVQKSHDYNHFALSKSSSLQALLHNIVSDVNENKLDNVILELEQAIWLSSRVDEEIRMSQEIMGGIKVVLSK